MEEMWPCRVISENISGWLLIFCVLVSWIVGGSGSCGVGNCIHGGRPRFS